MQQSASCNVPSESSSAVQTGQEVQQVEVPQSTAEETCSGLSQPLSGHSLSAAHHTSLSKPAPEVVMPDTQQPQQPSYAPCKSDLATLGCQIAGAPCTSASGSGQDESQPLQQLQHSEAGGCQGHGCGSISDAEFPQIAAAEADQSYASAETLTDLPAATMQHNDVVHPCQQSGLLSNQMYCAQLNGSEDAPEMPSQSSSDFNAERSVQQHADSYAVPHGHVEQRQFVGFTSGLSSSQSECSSSAEVEAIATECDIQSGRQLVVDGDIPTSSWVNRPSSGGHPSEVGSGDKSGSLFE